MKTLTMNQAEDLFDAIGACLDTAAVDVWHDGGCEYYNPYCGVVAQWVDGTDDEFTVRGYFVNGRQDVNLTGWTASQIAEWFVQATVLGEQNPAA